MRCTAMRSQVGNHNHEKFNNSRFWLLFSGVLLVCVSKSLYICKKIGEINGRGLNAPILLGHNESTKYEF